MVDKIWIYQDGVSRMRGNAWKRIDVTDPRLDTTYKYSPAGMARFLPRKGGAWIYVYIGHTREECAKNANVHLLERIEVHEKDLAILRTKLVVP